MKSPSVAKPEMPAHSGVSAQDGVHQVAELVEKGDHVGVLQQPGSPGPRSAGEIADERGFRQSAAAYAGDHRRGGEPLVLAFAGVHVEIEPAHSLAPSKTSKTETAACHASASERRNSILKSRAAVSSTPASTCG